MKRTYFILLLAAAALAGCSKEPSDPAGHDGPVLGFSGVAVQHTAGAATTGATTAAASANPVSAATAAPENPAVTRASAGYSDYTGDIRVYLIPEDGIYERIADRRFTYASGSWKGVDESGNDAPVWLTAAPASFFAWTPAAVKMGDMMPYPYNVSVNLLPAIATADNDLAYATAMQVSARHPFAELKLRRAYAKITLKVQAANDYPGTPSFTTLSIDGVTDSEVTLDLETGRFTFRDIMSAVPFDASAGLAGGTIPDAGIPVLVPPLVQELVERKPVTIGCTLDGKTFSGLETAITELVAGTNYVVTLRVSGQGITLHVTIADWTEGSGAGGELEEWVYPYVEGGKIIVFKDKYGSSDEPLHPDWEQTPNHNETSAEINRFGAKFEVALKDIEPAAWGSTNGGCTAPWRRPTIEELRIMYNMNDQLTGVMAFSTDELYWSATENLNPSDALAMNFDGIGGGEAVNKSAPFYTRCVRDVAFAPPTLDVDENGILVLKGAGGERGRMLFFQFGSVVGFTQEGDWAADKVLFNPVTGSPDYSDYTSIPVYASADWDANRKDISDPAYHNGANVKAGRGDPCKLVGLSATQIQGMSAAELDAYESGCRLPTQEENLAFTGQAAGGSYSAHWTASDARYDKWYYSSGSAGGYFPKDQEAQQRNYLPAAGVRNTSGVTGRVGLTGGYWSSTAGSSRQGYYLNFGSTSVLPLTNGFYASGLGVRCVRTTP